MTSFYFNTNQLLINIYNEKNLHYKGKMLDKNLLNILKLIEIVRN